MIYETNPFDLIAHVHLESKPVRAEVTGENNLGKRMSGSLMSCGSSLAGVACHIEGTCWQIWEWDPTEQGRGSLTRCLVTWALVNANRLRHTRSPAKESWIHNNKMDSHWAQQTHTEAWRCKAFSAFERVLNQACCREQVPQQSTSSLWREHGNTYLDGVHKCENWQCVCCHS